MDDMQQRPLSLVTASIGTPSESGESHEIKFTKKEGCTPTSCACVILAVLFVSLGAAAGVYFGLQFLDTNKRSERVYKGSFVVLHGDKYSSQLADSLSEEFQERSLFYKSKLEQIYNTSSYKESFLQAEVLALKRRENDQKLVVHFNLHLSPEQSGVTAADLYVILLDEVIRTKRGLFRGLEIDQDSIVIQERKPSEQDAIDRWVPRRQYPGYLEGLTTTTPTATSTAMPRRCVPTEMSFCDSLQYNLTSYPNLVGHTNTSEMLSEQVTYRQIVDFECYPLAYEFICQMLQPECIDDHIIVPCREFCEDFWRSCKKLLPRTVYEQIDCSSFPKYRGRESCRPKPGCANELRARGMEERLCDGVVDCTDYSDETMCDYCSPGQFFCGYRQCVDSSKRCDGRTDCSTGLDEKNCLTIAPNISSLLKQQYSYQKEGYLVFTESGSMSKICTDNLNNTLPSTRRDVILQSIAVTTCTALDFEVTENVEMRVDAENKSYVQMVDPLASNVAYVQASCNSQHVFYVKCGAIACGIRPSFTPRSNNGRLKGRTSTHLATHGQWPWHVALFKNGRHTCDGTLITDSWVLTSSACFQEEPRSQWMAQLGMVRLSSTSPFDQQTQVTGVLSSLVGGGKVAMVRLQNSVNGSDYVRPACILDLNHSVSEGLSCVTLSWTVKGDHLHHVQVTITSSKACTNETTIKNNGTASSSIVCAVGDDSDGRGAALENDEGREEEEDCKSEEALGRPLLCLLNNKWYLMGVASQEVPCARHSTPRAFHQTFDHVEWIRQTLDLSIKN